MFFITSPTNIFECYSLYFPGSNIKSFGDLVYKNSLFWFDCLRAEVTLSFDVKRFE